MLITKVVIFNVYIVVIRQLINLEVMKKIRNLTHGLSWLVTGVGAQGGDLKKSVKISNQNGIGVINISRGILYAGNGSIDDIIKSAYKYTKQIREIVCNPITC